MNPLLRQAEALIERGRYDLARPLVERALAEDPRSVAPRLVMTQLHLTAERWAEARRVAEEVIDDDPRCARAYYQLACAVFFDQGYAPSRDGPWWRLRGEAARDRPAVAIELIREALRLEPRHAPSHALHAMVLLQQERWEAAMAAAERGLAIDPNDAGCVGAAVNALHVLGRIGEAARLAARAGR